MSIPTSYIVQARTISKMKLSRLISWVDIQLHSIRHWLNDVNNCSGTEVVFTTTTDAVFSDKHTMHYGGPSTCL